MRSPQCAAACLAVSLRPPQGSERAKTFLPRSASQRPFAAELASPRSPDARRVMSARFLSATTPHTPTTSLLDLEILTERGQLDRNPRLSPPSISPVAADGQTYESHVIWRIGLALDVNGRARTRCEGFVHDFVFCNDLTNATSAWTSVSLNFAPNFGISPFTPFLMIVLMRASDLATPCRSGPASPRASVPWQ